MNLLKDRRGIHQSIEYIANDRMIIRYELPLTEMVLDFYDKLKSVSKGYASFDYNPSDHRDSDVVKLEILIHADVVDALVAELVRPDPPRHQRLGDDGAARRRDAHLPRVGHADLGGAHRVAKLLKRRDRLGWGGAHRVASVAMAIGQ